MPPKTLPEKSNVIVNTLKYFEALTDSEDKEAGESTESVNDTRSLMKVVTKCIIAKSFTLVRALTLLKGILLDAN